MSCISVSESERRELLDLYEIVSKEEQFWIDQFEKRTGFYAGLVLVIGAATIAGFLKGEDPVHFLGLTIGPIFMLLVCFLAPKAVNRNYQRFLEAVAKKAKVEQRLGHWDSATDVYASELRWLDAKRRNEPSAEIVEDARQAMNRWSAEPLINFRSFHARMTSLMKIADLDTCPPTVASHMFIKARLVGGSQRVTNHLFIGFAIVALLMLIGLALRVTFG